MYFEIYKGQLPQGAKEIREEVFVLEQGFQEEFDAIDQQGWHILLLDSEIPLATCRFYWDVQKEAFILGRVAVKKEFRGKSLGAKIVQEAERNIQQLGGSKLFLAAQLQAKPFYEKQGYTSVGDEFLDEHCPHIWMCKEFSYSL